MRYRYIAAVGLAAAVLGGVPAHAEDGPIAITVLRGGEAGAEIREGDTVAYAITVENTGDEAFEDLKVSHLLPAGFTLSDSEPAGVRGGGGVDWTLSLEPGERVEIEDTVRVGSGEQIEQGQLVVVEQPDLSAAPDEGTGFTTTVCAATAGGGEILGCASDQAALLDRKAPFSPWRWGAVAVGAAVVAAAAFVFGRRGLKARTRRA
ncbi:DUF11 domain-containing protein [Glycomyces sp. YM15]|uniref:DUF11 domain-containing protein n=1 Tax=Glycomyces sp. YM15 TaxID=2800446 RepID=UPI001964AC63|nr:DUF11 domain-containing protein [Glycomyces sp. YM15]